MMKKLIENIKSLLLDRELLTRLIAQIVSIVAVVGCVTIDGNKVYLIISVICNIVVTAYNLYINFSVTKEAKTADKVLKALKNDHLSLDQVNDFLNRVKNHTYFETYKDE